MHRPAEGGRAAEGVGGAGGKTGVAELMCPARSRRPNRVPPQHIRRQAPDSRPPHWEGPQNSPAEPRQRPKLGGAEESPGGRAETQTPASHPMFHHRCCLPQLLFPWQRRGSG